MLQIRLSAAILRGEQPALRFSKYECELPAAPDLEEGGPQNVTASMSHTVTVGSETVDLGWRRFFAHQVNVELTQLDDGGTRMVLTPYEEGSFIMQFAQGQAAPPSGS